MALRTGSNDWQELITKIGIPADSARTYVKTFVEESITKDSLIMIDREVLKELGVTTMGHALAIIKLAKEQPLKSDCYTKAPEEPNRLMDMLDALVTQKSNPMVHRLSFASISQRPGESVQQFVVCFRGTAQVCDFT